MVNSFVSIVISSLLITSNCFSLLNRSSRYLRHPSIPKSFIIRKMSDAEQNLAKDIDGIQTYHFAFLILQHESRSGLAQINFRTTTIVCRQRRRWGDSYRIKGRSRRIEGYLRCRAWPCCCPCRSVN